MLMFSDGPGLVAIPSSRRTFIWKRRVPLPPEDKRHRYGGAGQLVWEEIFLVPELTCMFRCNDDRPARDVFLGNMYAFVSGAPWVLNFYLWMLTPNPHHCKHWTNAFNRRISPRMDWPSILLYQIQ
ncbi:hypothetical protein AVEN_163734-1 [Araneus ventricosus]|uniref:Uncharacterized protein n=1 Tax=Araneus ventricosus TaxID=182803 RepID=A0A4Y2TS81_ARAVE|nr:hypothetical protein AVEN_163734-1 [Araneus ventricosus]